jgi:hypothetical protein
MFGRRGPKAGIGSLTTGDRYSMDIRRMQQKGVLSTHKTYRLTWHHAGEIALVIYVQEAADHLSVTHADKRDTGTSREMTYSIPLTWTDCHLGGERPWFRCPVRDCRRRVAILYMGHILTCRNCQGLVYQSQRERGVDRAARRANRIRERLDWEGGVLEGRGKKPLGMHRRTFHRLSAQHDIAAREALVGLPEYIAEFYL